MIARRGLPACLTAFLVARPGVASACSACYYGSDGVALAYLGTTALLSALPLALIGGICYWMVRRARSHRAMTSEPARPLGASEAPRRRG